MTTRSMYTYAIAEVSSRTYEEVKAILQAAGYAQAFHGKGADEVIDMHGIALKRAPDPPRQSDVSLLVEAVKDGRL